MAVEFKNAPVGAVVRVDMGFAHGEKLVAPAAYGPAEAVKLLAGFENRSGLVRPDEIGKLSGPDKQALLELLNDSRQELNPALPKLV